MNQYVKMKIDTKLCKQCTYYARHDMNETNYEWNENEHDLYKYYM